MLRLRGFPAGSAVKHPPAVQETQDPRVQSLIWEGPLEEGTAAHSSILAWRVPWPGGLAGYSPWGRRESDATGAVEQHVCSRINLLQRAKAF